MMIHIRDVFFFEYFEKKFAMKNAKKMFNHVFKHYIFFFQFKCFVHRWIKNEIFKCFLISMLIVLDFFCNFVVIVKMHHDNSNNEICNRKALHAFYDHFEKFMNENDDDNENFFSNFDYDIVKFDSFRLRRERRFKKSKQKIRVTMFFEKNKISENYDVEDEFWKKLKKLNCCWRICYFRVFSDDERDVDDDKFCFLIVVLNFWAWRWNWSMIFRIADLKLCYLLYHFFVYFCYVFTS